MNQRQFEDFYRAACAQRDSCRADPRLHPWFNSLPPYPPVLGFGLPANERRVPIVTIGLNPSIEEFADSLPDLADVSIQWNAQSHYFEEHCEEHRPYRWFRTPSAFLREATNNRIDYLGNPGSAHLDLAPLATWPFDNTYDKKAAREERAAAAKMLERSIRNTLLPLLDLLARNHDTRTIIMFGYLPRPDGRADKGSRTMRDVIGRARLFRLEERDDQGPIPLGRGRFDSQHHWLKEALAVHHIAIIFLARGPSSRAAARELPSAGRRLRALGWLKGSSPLGHS